MTLYHKHFLANLLIKTPPRDSDEVELFLALLIKRINMKIAKADSILKNPTGYYCPTLGNQGATGTGILETSHCALHSWDEPSIPKLHIDLYSCSDFNVENILTMCAFFDIISGDYIVIDRNEKLQIIEFGEIGENGVIIKRTENNE